MISQLPASALPATLCFWAQSPAQTHVFQDGFLVVSFYYWYHDIALHKMVFAGCLYFKMFGSTHRRERCSLGPPLLHWYQNGFETLLSIALSVRCQLQVILTAKRWPQEPPRVLFFSESMFTWIDQPIRAPRSATSASFFQWVNPCPNINKAALIMLLWHWNPLQILQSPAHFKTLNIWLSFRKDNFTKFFTGKSCLPTVLLVNRW